MRKQLCIPVVAQSVNGALQDMKKTEKSADILEKCALPQNDDVQFDVFGEEPTINELIQWSKREPMLCRVDQVVVSNVTVEEMNTFEIRF